MPDPTPPGRPPFGHGKPSPPRPAARAAPPPPPPPAFEVVADDVVEVVEVVDLAEIAEPPPPKRVKAAPARRAVAERDDDEPRPRPKAKLKKKPKRERGYDPDADAQAHRDQALAHYQWIAPAIVMAVGLVLCFVGGISAGGAVGLAKTLVVLVVGLVVTIPISVAALMLIGTLAGIDYGALGPGVFKIAAIASVANGIMFLGDGMGLPPFLYLPVSGLVTLVLFMTQFELDYGEANTSVGAINLLSFGVKTLLFLFLMANTPKSGDKSDEYRDDPLGDDPPAEVDRGRTPKAGKRGEWPKQVRPADPGDEDMGDDE